MLKFLRSGLGRRIKLIMGLWDREYHDSRLILEQDGDLKFFVISARFQANLARTLLVSVSATAVMLVGMSGTVAYLHARKLMLEASHKEIYVALQMAGISPDERNSEYTQEDMLEMATAIRERDIQVRQYVGDWTTNLVSRNSRVRGLLKNSGLNEKVIGIIQGTQKVGGSVRNFNANSLLNSDIAKEMAVNSEFKSLIQALPDKMPLDGYVSTSDFGIRKHPVNQKPSFHAGIDLLPSGGKDSVRAVKPGRVTIARYQGDLGNTVTVRHDRGLLTRYGHLDKIFVSEGQEATEGLVLGTVGNTGLSTGKHLHFEVLIGKYHVDPRSVVQFAKNVREIEK